jgi:hypothetical protein
VEPYLPPALVAPAARARLRAVADLLPAALSSCLYLECRLGPESRGADLIVGVEGAGRDILAGRNPALSVDVPAGAHPVWEAARAFCRAWPHDAGLRESVARIWLEFDAPDPGAAGGAVSGPPVPGIFIDLDEGAARAPARAARARLRRVLAAFGREPDAEEDAALARVLEALPAGAFAPYVGFFPGRAAPALRLCVAGAGAGALPEMLARCEWPGEARLLREALRGLSTGEGDPQPLLLHIDLAPAPLPRVGVEFVLDPAAQVRGEVRETAFLDRLVALGLCDAARRRALADWPGCTRERLDHELWPSLVLRRVNHLKVLFDGGAASAAKAYLVVLHAHHARRDRYDGRPDPRR